MHIISTSLIRWRKFPNLVPQCPRPPADMCSLFRATLGSRTGWLWWVSHGPRSWFLLFLVPFFSKFQIILQANKISKLYPNCLPIRQNLIFIYPPNEICSFRFVRKRNPNFQTVRLAGGWWLVLFCSERKVMLAGCWWLVCS
jgi:hypothetical protein